MTRRATLGAGLAALGALGAWRLRRRVGPPPEPDATPAAATWRISYGDAPRQVLDLAVPDAATTSAPVPVVVLVHGGFWRAAYDLRLMQPLVPGLLERGWAVANIEYRSVGNRDAGWPGTFDDAAAAIDALVGADAHLDLGRVVTVGHSAGGHLALWLAARHRLPGDAPGADPRIRPIGAVGQAAVADLIGGAQLGGGAATALLGGAPDEVPERYAAASPTELVPLGVPTRLIHGTLDRIVPLAQSKAFVAAAQAVGDDAEVVAVDGADHFDVIDPEHPAWAACTSAVAALLGAAGSPSD